MLASLIYSMNIQYYLIINVKFQDTLKKIVAWNCLQEKKMLLRKHHFNLLQISINPTVIIFKHIGWT